MKRRAVALVISLALVVPARGAEAQPAASKPTAVDEARGHFQRGIRAYKAGDFRSALLAFQEAYRASPNYRVLYNIGRSFGELQDFANAIPTLRQYLSEGGAELSKARRAEVETELERLSKQVVTLTIGVSEPGAEIVVDGERHYELSSPLASPLLLNAGSWSITAKKAGFEPAMTRFTVSSGEARDVQLSLVAQARAVATAPVPPSPTPSPPAPVAPAPSPRAVTGPAGPAPASERDAVSTGTWIGLAATGALAVGAGVTGALSLGAKSDYDAEIARFGTSADKVADARSRTRTLALTTDVLAGAAVVSAAVTVVLYVTSRDHGAVKPADVALGRLRF